MFGIFGLEFMNELDKSDQFMFVPINLWIINLFYSFQVVEKSPVGYDCHLDQGDMDSDISSPRILHATDNVSCSGEEHSIGSSSGKNKTKILDLSVSY